MMLSLVGIAKFVVLHDLHMHIRFPMTISLIMQLMLSGSHHKLFFLAADYSLVSLERRLILKILHLVVTEYDMVPIIVMDRNLDEVLMVVVMVQLLVIVHFLVMMLMVVVIVHFLIMMMNTHFMMINIITLSLMHLYLIFWMHVFMMHLAFMEIFGHNWLCNMMLLCVIRVQCSFMSS